MNINQKKGVANSLLQQLLIGKEIEIVDYSHTLNEIIHHGIVINETKEMIIIKENNKTLSFPKERITIKIKDERSNKFYLIDGKLLIGRPEERLKSSIRKMW